ncbi:MAG: PAQR family membrane homeostasis protein TrhA [Geminicoccales bacterium]
MQFPQHSKPERIADGIVHLIGITGGLGASMALAMMAASQSEPIYLASLGLYAFGLLAMLICSALYNISDNSWRKSLFQRLDHAAIFLMIAGTYTPFVLIAIGGKLGTGLLIFVWSVAGLGIVLKLICPMRWEGLSIAAYLLLGWTIVIAIDPLLASLSVSGIILLVAGGILYSLGVIFHKWSDLPYQNAIWHVFVLAAATCHFIAVLTDVAIAMP